MSVTATHATTPGPVPAANCFNMKQLENLVQDEVMSYYAEMQHVPKLANLQRSASAPVTTLNSRKTLGTTGFRTIDLDKNEKQVLVIYSGGTIGMSRGPQGSLVPIPNMLEKTVRKFPHMHDEDYAKERFGDAPDAPLCLPDMHGEKNRVIYRIYEYAELLDSTNMSMDDWIHIAQDVKNNYEHFDGFVILHGTDTMSYTASALSFMMESLGKAVIVTGSQIPLFESRSDGRDNFLGALILAGNYCIPEVSVYFGHKLFRGNRVTKVSSDSLNAFDSPNLAPLATMGINIQVDYGNIWRPRDISPFNLHTNLDRNVSLLRIFPSITLETVKVYLQAPTQGVVLQTYGAGNFPVNRTDLLDELRNASQRGVLIVNCTQCGHGSVSAIYETGALLMDAGVIPGWDMTPESALCKLSYVLGRNDWDIKKKRDMLMTSLRGELTSIPSKPSQFVGSNHGSYVSSPTGDFYQNNAESPNLGQQFGLDVVQTIVKVVANKFNLQTPDEIAGVKKLLTPSLSCALVAQCSKMNYSDEAYEKNLNDIFGNSEAEISEPDYSGRTPLHYSAALGDDRTLEYLLKHGASVHVRDRDQNVANDFLVSVSWINLMLQSTGFCDSRGFSPLRDAIEFDRHEVINVLRKCGAHLTFEPTALGAELCLAASKGSVLRLRSYELAGANLNQEDPCGRTALHAATESRNKNVVEWLLLKGASKNVKNALGQSPLDIAKLLNCQDLISLLEKQ
ncbi:L-asparaginase [Orchesella cincta]|uniref:asparaginase n=1 Tax=Orchesella cincta TaxID=48709 RepID=A0A1D2NAM8_ORCCI|nr:L-asparaginase [Orchesella cincta]